MFGIVDPFIRADSCHIWKLTLTNFKEQLHRQLSEFGSIQLSRNCNGCFMLYHVSKVYKDCSVTFADELWCLLITNNIQQLTPQVNQWFYQSREMRYEWWMIMMTQTECWEHRSTIPGSLQSWLLGREPVRPRGDLLDLFAGGWGPKGEMISGRALIWT